MPSKKIKFSVGEIYHLYNRGVDKRSIFSDTKDLERFIETINIVNSSKNIISIRDYKKQSRNNSNKKPEEKIIEFIAIALLGNHYHFLVREIKEAGISKFMQKFGIAYTNYFNIKHRRSGSLFQGKFKSKHIDTNEYLLHISAYINLNNKLHPARYRIPGEDINRTSWGDYVGERNVGVELEKSIIEDQFKGKKHYKKFALSTLRSIKERKILIKELEIDGLI